MDNKTVMSSQTTRCLTTMTPPQSRQHRCPTAAFGSVSGEGFTLVEVIVAFSIFLVVMALVSLFLLHTFRSFHQGQQFQARQLKTRACLFQMSKEIASLVKVFYPQENYNFKAKEESFFLSSAKNQAWQSQGICVIYPGAP